MIMAEVASSMTSETKNKSLNSPPIGGGGVKEFTNLIRRMEVERRSPLSSEPSGTSPTHNFNNNNLETLPSNSPFNINASANSPSNNNNNNNNNNQSPPIIEMNKGDSTQFNKSNLTSSNKKEVPEQSLEQEQQGVMVEPMEEEGVAEGHHHHHQQQYSPKGGSGRISRTSSAYEIDDNPREKTISQLIRDEKNELGIMEDDDENLGGENNNLLGMDEEFSQSENEMPVEDEEEFEDEEEEEEEHRITVREALMSRAFQAAAAAKFAGGKYPASSKTGFGGSTQHHNLHHHAHPGQGSRTNRSSSGITSPSLGSRGHQGYIPSSKHSLNGHGSVRSERHTGSSSGGHPHSRSGLYGNHQNNSSSNSYHHSHHLRHQSRNHQGHDGQEPYIKSERKSHPNSPIHCDLKPDSLGQESGGNGNLNGIGNALLSLASLGSLAALQQSVPNFMANVIGHPSLQGNLQLPPNLMNAPLNLTHSNNSSSSSLTSSPHPQQQQSSQHYPHHHSQHHQKNSSSNVPHSLQQQQQQLLSHPQQSGSSSNLSPNSLIANAIANLASGGGAGGSQASAAIAAAAANAGANGGAGGTMPQFILASGHITQGIQGAQLLIPTSQGIMQQTVLTIPITQPGSPQQNMLSPSPTTNSTGGGNSGSANVGGHHGSSSSGNSHLISSSGGGSKGQSHSQQHNIGHGHSQHHHHHSMNLGHHSSSSRNPSSSHPQHSPSISHHPSSASPDFSGSTGSSGLPLMGLPSHLVGQQYGAHMPTIQEKMILDHNNGRLNGVRNAHGKRERDGGSGVNTSSTPGGLHGSSLCPPKSSPCSAGGSIHEHESDKLSDNDDDQMVDGINLDEIKEFAKAFKLRRLSLGLTQTQVGQALSVTEGPAYSQSAICSALAWQLAQSQSQSYPPPSIHQQSMFEKLDITPKSAQKIKPVLERWMKEAEERYKNGHQNLNEFVGMEPSKKRKRRTSFTPQALEILNNHFERNTHPSGAEITTLAHQLGYEREVIRIWFCNKRQALKNTVRMMSKGSSPM